MRVIELFSGIGGMHYALQDSGLDYEVTAAADINSLANEVYKHNVPSVNILQTNIQSLSAQFFNKLDPHMFVMSPPCQPFTRVGLKKDVSDARTCPLLSFISLLPDLSSKMQYILLENVQGFEVSQARSMLLQSLSQAGFSYQEFLLSPSQLGIPNSRSRYYLIAKRKPLLFVFQTTETVMKELPDKLDELSCRNEGHTRKGLKIEDYLEISDEKSESYDRYLVPDKVLEKRIKVFDVVVKTDSRSLCFTKAYSHYAEGTGSVYCPFDRQTIEDLYEKSKKYLDSPDERLAILKELRLRYFTPREVANLMCFPESFDLPRGVTDRQGYRLLGNSINVHVVGALLAIMCQEPENPLQCDNT